MSEKHFDLSKLRIRKDTGIGPNYQDAPRSGRSSLLLYIIATIFVIIAIYLAIKTFTSKDEAVEVTTVTMISPAQFNALLTASGYVVAQRKASIASKATGRLVYLGFKEGDRVKEGQIIARIESEDVEAALAQAKAQLEVAKSDRVDAEQSLERANKLISQKLISQADYEATKARYDRVIAMIAANEAAVRVAEVSLENTRIRAPFDGTILTKNADVGEVVAPYAAGASSRVAVVTIADMNSLEVEADVSESNIEKIESGQPCEITLDAYPEKRYRGIVDKIVPTADRAKATVQTKVRFLDKDRRVLPEMGAKVHFLSKQSSVDIDTRPRIVVDPSAITTRRNDKVVFVVNEKTVREVPVTTGDMIGRLIEIRSGLSTGDRVVVKPSEELQSGTTVVIKQ
jgi:RND family efflux transporter MFP subunit